MRYSTKHVDIVNQFKQSLRKPSKESLVIDSKINPEAIKDALKLAFPDITPRTMKRDETGKDPFDQLPDKLFDYSVTNKQASFGEQIADWFDEEPKYEASGIDIQEWRVRFDKFHKCACEAVLTFLKDQGYTEKSVTYGKAQKVVNMTFKHLYCLEGAGDKEEWFIPCHIALDSFTLEWFKRTIVETSKHKLTKGKVDSWSALQDPETDEYPGKNNGFYSYHTIVDLIRKYFDQEKPFNGLNPLQAEFYIWPEIQLHLAAEALYGQNIGKEAAVAEASEKWNLQWEADAEKDITKQFIRCKQVFKTRSLKEKVEFLKSRVEQLHSYVNT